MIARTETAKADVEGNIEAYKQSGVVSGKQWITGAGCCDLCDELDGTIVEIDEDFPNEGGSGPPLHPNCRCDVLPVLTED
jgi:SPP1 gp7 family putative phage head morphogenesis protein